MQKEKNAEVKKWTESDGMLVRVFLHRNGAKAESKENLIPRAKVVK